VVLIDLVVPTLLLKVFQSVDERYPLVEEFDWEIEIVLFAIDRGEEAEVILFKYALFQSVVDAERGILYPAVNENTPVPEVYVNPEAEDDTADLALESV
jgi:hypothetical protein